MTTADFEKTYTNGQNQLYRWLTADKTRAKLAPNIFHNTRIMAEIDEVIEAHGGWPDAFQTGGESVNQES